MGVSQYYVLGLEKFTIVFRKFIKENLWRQRWTRKCVICRGTWNTVYLLLWFLL